MISTFRRAVRVTAAAALACGLIGAQGLVTSADASGITTVTWRPSSPPAGTGFWSNVCPTSGQSATGIPTNSSNLHSGLSDDRQAVAASRTLVAESGADIGWHYAPTSGNEGGPSITLTNPATIASISAAVAGTTTGHAMVFYQATGASDYYVGIAPLTSPGSTWARQTATTFSWYHWSPNLVGGPSWKAQNVAFLASGPTPTTVAAFATGANDTGAVLHAGVWYASIELGCTGAFAVDHLEVTDSSGNVTDYDLQNPLSVTTTTSSMPSIGPGGSATISASTVAGGAVVSDGTITLQSSTDGTTWTNGPTQPTGTAFAVAPTQTTDYRVAFDGAPDAAASASANAVTVQVAPELTLKTSRSTMNLGNAETFATTFSPVHAAIHVTLQQLVGTTWQSLGTAVTNTSGVATLTKTRSTMGAWRVRALAVAQGGYLASTSNTVSVGVYQPVSLSIYRSYTTVYVGRSFRIYGTVTPRWSGIRLQLQQYVGRRWVAVASGSSGTRGTYSFTRVARTVGSQTLRVVALASGYRRAGGSAAVRVRIIHAPVYTPRPTHTPPATHTPPRSSGGGGSGIG